MTALVLSSTLSFSRLQNGRYVDEDADDGVGAAKSMFVGWGLGKKCINPSIHPFSVS